MEVLMVFMIYSFIGGGAFAFFKKYGIGVEWQHHDDYMLAKLLALCWPVTAPSIAAFMIFSKDYRTELRHKKLDADIERLQLEDKSDDKRDKIALRKRG